MAEKRSRSATHYMRRMFEDEYVQDQLRDASSSLVTFYRRARKKGAEAPEDKKVYGSLRQAATSARNLVVALQRPEPEPRPKHRIRHAVVVLALVGGSVLVIKREPAPAGPSGPAGD